MGLTKANFYLAVLFVVAMFSFMIYSISIASYNNPNIDLDVKSQEYVLSYSTYYGESDFDSFSETPTYNSSTKNIFTGTNETGEVIATDNFAIPKATQGSLVDTPNFFKKVFNVPTLMLMGVGISINEVWKSYINIFAYVLSFCLLILFVKMTFNGGNS